MAVTKQSVEVNVAVIGAGSAGISAFRQLTNAKVKAVLIDPGPLGTLCARTGCMPSKALISAANDYHRRQVFEREGIRGAEGLACDLPAVLAHVRKLRDHFTAGMVETTNKLAGDQLIRERAWMIDQNTVETDHHIIKSERIIIATGAKPVVPDAWKPFSDRILTSESIFEQTDLPRRLAVVGMGVEGLELGQALGRLGVDIVCFGRNKNMGGVTDPEVNNVLQRTIGKEIDIHAHAEAAVHQTDDGFLMVEADGVMAKVDGLLLATGLQPNLSDLGLDTLGLDLDARGMPPWNPETGQVADLPVYLAGDATRYRTVLHEAIDEGFIAAFNAGSGEKVCARRRVPLRICFSDPQAVVVGRSWKELESGPIVVGEVDCASASRAVLEQRAAGCLRVYAGPESGLLLGAEMAAPEAEHLGHLLALAMQNEMTVDDLLRMPFYHPTLTEAVRSALRDAAGRVAVQRRTGGLVLGGCCPEQPL